MATSRTDTAINFHRAAEGVVWLAETNPIEALRLARKIVRQFTDQPGALRLLAFALRKAKRDREADSVDIEAIALSQFQPAFVAAREAWLAGKWEDAEVLVRGHLKSDPEDAGAAKMLADIALRFGAIRESEIFYQRSLMLAPGYHEARLALAMLLSRTGRTSDAFAAIEEVLRRDANNVAALSIKAGLLSHERRLEEAEKLFRRLLARHPRNATAWLNYGYLLKTVGRLNDSVAAYRRAITFEKGNGLAWFGLANLKTIELDDADIEAMREALFAATNDEQSLHLHFALSKALDDRGLYESSFEHLTRASALRRAKAPHDADAVSAEVRKVEKIFSREFVTHESGSPAKDPIFIVSLPRSGSTLVEQILGSHMLIEGTEELYEIEGIARNIGNSSSFDAYLDHISRVSEAKFQSLGEEYIRKTKQKYRLTDRPYFTDKMPGNWRLIGLIHKILPNAKIIDIRRHPLGCGYANYSQHFNWGVNFSYDLSDIGRFYSDYVRQMDHFDRILPGKIHRIFYEDLVDNFEYEVGRLLEYIEIPFDPACLRFYENKRPVHTPSSEQVRRPIQRAGLDRWRHYEPWLGPLKQSLGAVLDCYPEVPSFK